MSKFVEDGTEWLAGLRFPICNGCEHYRGAGRCDAFPERIPDAILDGEHDHHEPYPGDGGIRFKAARES